MRISCANDVRKRDVQIQRLKGHLTGAQRGSNTRVVGASCTISTGSGTSRRDGLHSSAPAGAGGMTTSRDDRDQPRLQDAEYSLKQETTEFLTQLSQGMSDENDALIALVKETLRTLRHLMNLPPGPAQASQAEADADNDEMVSIVPTSFSTLSNDLEFVLGKLQVLLTRDDFVPINEVYARDEEIERLRDGWEKMGLRWREAVEMMREWQGKLSGGGTVGVEDLTRGMNLGEGLQGFGVPFVDGGGVENEVGTEPGSDVSNDVSMNDECALEAPELELDSPVPAPKRSPPVLLTALREAPSAGNLVSPTRPSGARKPTQQRSIQQENKPTRTSSNTNSNTSSAQSNRSTDLDLKGLNITRNGPQARNTQSARPTSATSGSTASSRNKTTADTDTKSRPGTARRATRQSQNATQPPLHRHLSTLMNSSSPFSGDDASPQKDGRMQLERSRTMQTPTTGALESGSLSAGSLKSRGSGPAVGRMATAPAERAKEEEMQGLDEGKTEGDEEAGGRERLSVQDKLRMAEREARRMSEVDFAIPEAEDGAEAEGQNNDQREEAAAAPTPTRLARKRQVSSGSMRRADEGEKEERDEVEAAKVVVVKSPSRAEKEKPQVRKREKGTINLKGRPRKRKSTLSPTELEELMGLRSPPT